MDAGWGADYYLSQAEGCELVCDEAERKPQAEDVLGCEAWDLRLMDDLMGIYIWGITFECASKSRLII